MSSTQKTVEPMEEEGAATTSSPPAAVAVGQVVEEQREERKKENNDKNKYLVYLLIFGIVCIGVYYARSKGFLGGKKERKKGDKASSEGDEDAVRKKKPIPAPPVGPFGTNLAFAEKMRDVLVGNVDSTKIDALVKEYSTYPHIAGSVRNTELARRTAQRYRDYGFDDVREEKVPVVLMKVLHRSVNKTDPKTGAVLYKCSLEEKNIQGQKQWESALPPTNGYSGQGRVENKKLVWVNYGRARDFEDVAHIDLTDTIVVVRYGKIFRGNKVRLAQNRGASGVIIVNDKADVVKGATFPDGPWATNTSVQRGSVYLGEGDPLSPGWPSEMGGPQLEIDGDGTGSSGDLFDDEVMVGNSLPRIPVQPMGYGDARSLLQGLAGGNKLPAGTFWKNTGFADLFASGIGPGPATASMEVRRKLIKTTLTNVIATIKGGVEPDRTVTLGSHRDAWTYGAVDPISGHSVQLEIARNLGYLHKQHNWVPRRSIQMSSWDGEEWAILGSVEYVESVVELLRQRAVVHLNLDTAVTGTDVLDLSGSPSLIPLLKEVAAQIPHPRAKGSDSKGEEGEAIPARQAPKKVSPKTLLDIMEPVGPPGAGSDHIGFLQLAGVPVVTGEIRTKSLAYQAVYHSNYDNYDWVAKFGDPNFVFHAGMAKYFGVLAMRLADDPLLPLSMTSYSNAVAGWVDQYKIVNPALEWAFMSGAVKQFEAACKSHERKKEAMSSTMNTMDGEKDDDDDEEGKTSKTGDEDAGDDADDDRRQHRPYHHHIGTRVSKSKTGSSKSSRAPSKQPSPSIGTLYELRAINDVCSGLERVFLSSGVGKDETGQPWYKHVLYTPSATNSYGATVMPIVADAITTYRNSMGSNATGAKGPQAKKQKANFAIGRIAQYIERAAVYTNTTFVYPL